MVKIDVEYQGNLRCQATHADTGTSLQTVAPKDNQGDGSTFSPTDLLATALGTCMLTIMGITARRLEVDLTGVRAAVTKEMTTGPVRRVGALGVTIVGPGRVSAEHRVQLERAALACPVHRSLHPDVQIPVTFRWE